MIRSLIIYIFVRSNIASFMKIFFAAMLLFFSVYGYAQVNTGLNGSISKAQADTAFAKQSGIDTIDLHQQQLTNLTLLGQVWGFLKYHHPAVAKGNFNFDAELFRVMPAVLRAKNNAELSRDIELWVDHLGKPDLCRDCKSESGKNVAHQPDYGRIFNADVLAPSLIDKLKYIRQNRNTGDHYYIGMVPNLGNPLFSNEKGYAEMVYPDTGYRLLCLYRYWNMIQYFFPYKHLIGRDWNAVLPEFIPRFIKASNKTDYVLASLAMIANIHDTHANIWIPNQALENFRGLNAFPFQAKFIENKLMVTGFYADTLDVKRKLKIGDIITRIDGESVEDLIKRYLPLTAASNYATQLRNLPRNYLLRTNKTAVPLEIVRTGKSTIINMNTVEYRKLNTSIDDDPNPASPGYQVMDGKIGYVFAAKYKNKDLWALKKTFANTKGIIIDMRCYPSDVMVFTFVPYIKSGNAEFVKITHGSVANPGLFKFFNFKVVNRGKREYKGKVVVIVNEQSVSQAEYTTMAFQSSPNVTVIGSTTAGADGDVSRITLPGGIGTAISGLGILYPDGTETQRKGVKIDLEIHPTMEGIKAGRDELLEKAKQIINGN